MKRLLFFIFVFLSIDSLFGGDDSVHTRTDYSFIIMDSPARLFTMRQFNADYFSAYRLIFRGMNTAVKNDRIVEAMAAVSGMFFFVPLTHEEGHRSILTAKNIGSISRPYFNSKGAAYVTGVTDRQLRDLRDNDLPCFIRLHTAGIESDYMLTRRAEAIGYLGLDAFENYRWEYWMRKLAIVQYYLSGLFRYEVNIDEEAGELDRDIVGFDTYGAVRHLFRPDMEFYRYTRYEELTEEERRFIRRSGWRSLLNLISPMIAGRERFTIGKKIALNGAMGYTMAPFGDFIDENIWLKYRAMNVGIYFRQFQNRRNWFFGGGLSLHDYSPVDRLSISAACHLWRQPEKLDFNTSRGLFGGAVEADIGFFLLDRSRGSSSGLSLDAGFIYKSDGFLPEEVCMKEHWGLRIGTTIRK